MIWFYIAGGIIGIALAVWGTQTKGTWSQWIGIIGGLIWLPSVIASFFVSGLKTGAIFLVTTFVLGAVLSKVFPKI